MSEILILSNHDLYTYKFRKEVIQSLVDRGNQVTIALPNGPMIEKLINIGCQYIEVDLDRRGTNLWNELKLIWQYFNIFRKLKPEYVITYTIKPNIYGGILSRIFKSKNIPNVTGLGSSFSKESLSLLLKVLYNLAFSKSTHILFQNETDLRILKNLGVNMNQYSVIPGSGINISENSYLNYPLNSDELNILYIGRVMKEKGINELFQAARIIKSEFSNVNFNIIGFYEKDFQNTFEKMLKEEVFNYFGFQEDTDKYISEAHVIVQPSYSEGMSNVLLEASARGRPVLASNIPGCKEIVDNYKTGFLFEPRNVDSLVLALKNIIHLSNIEKESMGKKARQKVIDEFSRDIIVKKYLELTGGES